MDKLAALVEMIDKVDRRLLSFAGFKSEDRLYSSSQHQSVEKTGFVHLPCTNCTVRVKRWLLAR